MHSQMHSQTLAALRSEISAVTTLQAALNRIALTVDENALSHWDGPRPEDVDDVAADDGSFSRDAVVELRSKAGHALSTRYREVERVVAGRAALESLLRSVLATGTGGVIGIEGPPPADVLNALARSGALRLDWAQDASVRVRDVLDGVETAAPRPTAPASPLAKEGKARAPAPKASPKTKAKAKPKAKPAAKAKAARKPAAKTRAASKAKPAKKKPAPPAKKKPAAKGKRK